MLASLALLGRAMVAILHARLGLDARRGAAAFLCAIPLRQEHDPRAIAVVFSVAAALVQSHLGETRRSRATANTRLYRTEPNLLAYALVAAFAVFVIWWGVRRLSRALVNLGIVGFAVTVVWFFFSDIFDKVGRSLGLIAMGILFLAGGWGLEKMRRRLIGGMTEAEEAKHEARQDFIVWTSLALLVIQLAIVSSVAAKYLYQRWNCPRVWTRTAMYDPDLSCAAAT